MASLINRSPLGVGETRSHSGRRTLGWPPVVVLQAALIAKFGGVAWAVTGMLFLTMIFGSASLVLSLLLPTYRIIAEPPALLVLFWIVSDGAPVPPYLLPWITTFTAIGLLVPQWSNRVRVIRF